MEKLRIILLSGPLKVGKSALSTELAQAYGFLKVSSSEYLRTLVPKLTGSDASEIRLQLQEKGDQLDRDTDYMWVIDPVTTSAITRRPDVSNWLVDAVRKQRQVEHFRNLFGSGITHIHLIAPEATLRERTGLADEAYEKAICHTNEVSSRALGKIADHVFDTSLQTPRQLAVSIVEQTR